MHSVVKKTETYQFGIRDINQEFKIRIEIRKLEKDVLLELPNSNYPKIKNSYNHQKDITINDTDTKTELPIHVILGVGDYTKIKTQEEDRLGQPGEPIAELQSLGGLYFPRDKKPPVF